MSAADVKLWSHFMDFFSKQLYDLNIYIQIHKPYGQIGNLSQPVARSLYKRGVFTKSVPEETRTITVPSLSWLTQLYFSEQPGRRVLGGGRAQQS